MKSFLPDLDLIEKYNQPAPRYTSYPTSIHFTESANPSNLMENCRDEIGSLSLYFHLPFCESLCWFCGCNTNITVNHHRVDTYLECLEKEIKLVLPYIAPGRSVAQLHLGGGTPNFFTPAQIDRLSDLIHDHFTFQDNAENSVELDPRRLTKEHVSAFRRMGINRASFGIQDCNPEVQQAIHRIQPQKQNIDAVNMLRDAGFQSINIDLVYGLPRQTPKSFRKTIDDVLWLNPDRIATFSYAHVPWLKPAQKLLERTGLPSPETKFNILRTIIKTLTEMDYLYVGMDHFAKEDDELVRAQRAGTLQRNFQGYSTHGGTDICGFGVSSISQTSRSYRQNAKTLEKYYAAISKGKLPIERGYILNNEDFIRRETITRLMCDLALNYNTMSNLLGVDFKSHFASEIENLADLEKDGLLTLNPDRMELTDTGRLLIRNIAAHFDAYLDTGKQAYSKTV